MDYFTFMISKENIFKTLHFPPKVTLTKKGITKKEITEKEITRQKRKVRLLLRQQFIKLKVRNQAI